MGEGMGGTATEWEDKSRIKEIVFIKGDWKGPTRAHIETSQSCLEHERSPY